MTTEQIRSEFQARVEGKINDASGDDHIVYLDLQQLFDVVMQMIRDGKLTQGDAQFVVPVVEEAFDKYVVPQDIPWLPPLIEARAEAVVRALIPAGIDLIFSALPSDENSVGQAG